MTSFAELLRVYHATSRWDLVRDALCEDLGAEPPEVWNTDQLSPLVDPPGAEQAPGVGEAA